MIVCGAGDAHGKLTRMYDDIMEFERSLGIRFDWVLHVGDFGIWPDANEVDRATRKHGDVGDFPTWIREGTAIPRPTIFIKGNHEDFEWLSKRPSCQILTGLTYLPNGKVMELGEGFRISGVGGCFGSSDYERNSRDLRGYARRHYTRDEVEAVGKLGHLDVLLLHDAPKGVEIVKRRGTGAKERYFSTAEGLDDALKRTRPKVCFFGHHHARVDADVHGVTCLGLNMIGHPGSLVAVELSSDQAPAKVLGEWPKLAHWRGSTLVDSEPQ